MDLGPGWIKRDDLLEVLRLQGLSVSNHQLLRWHNAGILTQPKRVGHGRNRGGSDSYYPWWGALQALEIGWRLKEERRRSRKPKLADVGWALWTLGYPVTDFARELLLDELKEEEEASRLEHERYLKKTGESLFERPEPRIGMPGMRNVVRPDAMPKVARMLVELELGILADQEYEPQDWELLQEAVISEMHPELLDHPELPTPEEVEAGLRQQSSRQPLGRTIKALEEVDKRRLCKTRNEAQALHELLGGSNEVMSRRGFVHYFKLRHVDPESAKRLAHLPKAMGWSRTPLSPLGRAVIKWVSRGEQHQRYQGNTAQ
jgi:hypothetical protein